MSKNPFLNALSATAYIAVVASVMFYAPKTSMPADGVIVPIAILSLFVLSAAMMGYFFLYHPVQLLIEGKQKEATKLFLSTVAIFACITLVMISTWIFLDFFFLTSGIAYAPQRSPPDKKNFLPVYYYTTQNKQIDHKWNGEGV